MKTSKSAEEYFRLNYSTHFDNNNDRMCYAVDCYDAMQEYSTYLLNHHLEQFAEECAENFKLKEHNVGEGTFHQKKEFYIDPKSINQTLTDYKLKNNIK